MTDKMEFNSLLVPHDFSEAAQRVFQWARNLVDGEEPSIILMHVIDEELVAMLESNQFGTRTEIIDKLRLQADLKLDKCLSEDFGKIDVKRIVSVGIPFLEITRKAKDFAVDAVVMGRAGAGQQVGHLLFGSTAEHVLRGCTRPVIVLPTHASEVNATH